MRIRGTVAAAILVGMASTARAGVIEYAVAKVRTFTQTADDTAPTTETRAFLFGQVTLDAAGEFDAVSVEGSDGMTFDLVPSFGGADWDGAVEFGSVATLDAVHPNGTTTIHGTGGTLGPASEPTTLVGDYPDVPFFTGSVFSDLRGVDSTQDFLLTWHAPSGTIASSATTETIFEVYIDQIFGGEAFYLDGLGTSTTSVLLPGGTLQPNTAYEIAVLYGNVTEDDQTDFPASVSPPVGPFPTGIGITGFASQTVFEFTTGAEAATVPEPSSMALLLTGATGFAGYYRRRRRLRKTVSAS